MKDSAVRNPSAAHRPRVGHVQPAGLQQLTVPTKRGRGCAGGASSAPSLAALSPSRKQALYFQISFLALTRL